MNLRSAGLTSPSLGAWLAHVIEDILSDQNATPGMLLRPAGRYARRLLSIGRSAGASARAVPNTGPFAGCSVVSGAMAGVTMGRGPAAYARCWHHLCTRR